jgi:DNA topoisomerase-2
MGTIMEPKITPSNKKSYTKITFKPDLERFGMTHLDDDIISLMTKRVYDIAGCNPTVKVTLNGTRIPTKSFQKYCELYLKVNNFQ